MYIVALHWTTLYKLTLLILFGPGIAQLGSEDYLIREAAEYRLSCWADLCWPLVNACSKSKDLEVRKRIDRIKRCSVPDYLPPLTLLSSGYMLEWYRYDCNGYCYIGDHTKGHYLGYLRPNYYQDKKSLLGYATNRVVEHYAESARTQYQWKDWHIIGDSRQATKLLVRDLERIGIPIVLIKMLVRHLRDKEDRLYYPSENVRMARIRE